MPKSAGEAIVEGMFRKAGRDPSPSAYQGRQSPLGAAVAKHYADQAEREAEAMVEPRPSAADRAAELAERRAAAQAASAAEFNRMADEDRAKSEAQNQAWVAGGAWRYEQ